MPSQEKLEVVGITTRSRTQIRCGSLQQYRMMSASSSALMNSGLPSNFQYSSNVMPISAWMLVRIKPGAMLMTRTLCSA